MSKHTGWRVASSLDMMTIAYGSEMLLYVRNYKTDVHDETIEVNACIVGPLNMGKPVRIYSRV